jgi:hypothetical protein
MKQIFGHVLVKETNAGVPNLVVTAFDTENPIKDLIAYSGEIVHRIRSCRPAVEWSNAGEGIINQVDGMVTCDRNLRCDSPVRERR